MTLLAMFLMTAFIIVFFFAFICATISLIEACKSWKAYSNAYKKLEGAYVANGRLMSSRYIDQNSIVMYKDDYKNPFIEYDIYNNFRIYTKDNPKEIIGGGHFLFVEPGPLKYVNLTSLYWHWKFKSYFEYLYNLNQIK